MTQPTVSKHRRKYEINVDFEKENVCETVAIVVPVCDSDGKVPLTKRGASVVNKLHTVESMRAF